MSEGPSSASPPMRAGDADRERAVEALRGAFAEGRLSRDELDERTASAYAATTVAELGGLTADLPASVFAEMVAAAGGDLPMEPDSRPGVAVVRDRGRELRRLWLGWSCVAAVLTAVWAATAITSSTVPPYWPVWPLGFLGAGCAARTIKGKR